MRKTSQVQKKYDKMAKTLAQKIESIQFLINIPGSNENGQRENFASHCNNFLTFMQVSADT